MSVLISTSLGDIVIDLFTDRCPLTTKNFLKLCRIKYYNGCLFHTVQKDFTAQTGDPTGRGSGGDSVYKFLYGQQARFFMDEIHPDLKHSKAGTVSMASAGENLNASQFYFTLRDDLDYLDGKHTVFGEIAEGMETLMRINEAFVDEHSRPYKNIRIKHTYILDDPFDDPVELAEFIPEASPEGKPSAEALEDVRLEDDWVPLDEQLDPAELEQTIRAKEAHSRAVVLEMIGDIPEAEAKPPENVLFVCKLNPVTQDEDLEIIFSRFGKVISADIIRDYKTGDSLCYAFIEFETEEACEAAYFKMDNVLIDDRRIHVDFSQSVAKLWSQYRRGGKKSEGKGCFKCGALDHYAKDCTEGANDKGNIKPPETKYVLKDGNRQHGSHHKSYEMVFDEDSPEKHRLDVSRKDELEADGSRDKNVNGRSEHKRHDDVAEPGSSKRRRDSKDKHNDEEYEHRRNRAGGHDDPTLRGSSNSRDEFRQKSKNGDHRNRNHDDKAEHFVRKIAEDSRHRYKDERIVDHRNRGDKREDREGNSERSHNERKRHSDDYRERRDDDRGRRRYHKYDDRR